MPAIDHIGIVVDDLDAAVKWWAEALRADVVWRETPKDVDPIAIGLPGERVRIGGGAILWPHKGGSYLEINAFEAPADGAPVTRRTHDHGLGHLALHVERGELEAEGARLQALGVIWNTSAEEIPEGGLAGHWWRYGLTPTGVTIELCWHPDSA